MPVPSEELSTGMYFQDIEGYTASDFETTNAGNGFSYTPACMTPGVAYFITSSGNTTDMNSLAIMPCNYSPGWYTITSEEKKYFNKSFDWSPSSARVGYNFIRHTTPSKDYPLSLAKKGYRTYTSDEYDWETASYKDRNFYPSYTYNVWANTELEKVNTSTSSPIIIIMNTTGYYIEGSFHSWSKTPRNWIGIVLQAGGGGGGNSWGNHVGGGGSGGACWVGLVNLSAGGETTITINSYSSSSGLGGGEGKEEGARITLSNSRCTITANPGYYGTGKANSGTTPGGTVETVGSGFITYLNCTGGKGSYASGSADNRISVSSLASPTPDQKSIPFVYSSTYLVAYGSVWWGSKVVGQGGMSVYGMGGLPEKSGSAYADAGVGGKWRTYGAGGGGSANGDWGIFTKWPGGSGGYPYVRIGF